jgi:hypothetical protein
MSVLGLQSKQFNLICEIDVNHPKESPWGYGARQCGAQSNAVNLILKVSLVPIFTYDKLESVQQQPQHTKTSTNTTTMVAELLEGHEFDGSTQSNMQATRQGAG